MLKTRREAHEFYKKILQTASLISDDEVQATMAYLGRTDLFFLLVFILHRNDVDRDWLYDRCKEVQDNPNGYLDLWARGHYKSTLITYAKTIQDVIDSHSPEPFHWPGEQTFAIFSYNRPIAKAFLAQIMLEFESNDLLKSLYPSVLWDEPRKQSSIWSLDKGILLKRKSNPKELTIEAWGLVDGQPTSKHFNVLVYDDVVTRENVTTVEQVRKTTAAWELSLNLQAEGHHVERYIGTRYAYFDTYRTMIERGVPARLYPATDDGKVGGAPVLLTREELLDKYEKMGPEIFACQMLLDPKKGQVATFEEDDFKYWDVAPEKWKRFNRVMLVDPANSKKKESDYTVILVIGLGSDENYYLVHGECGRWNLNERTNRLFYMHKVYKPQQVGYEEYGLQADIEHIKYVMEHSNYRFEITPLGGKIAKEDRIKRLIPIAKKFRLWLPLHDYFVDNDKQWDFTRLIVEQFVAFPVLLHDDMIDCAARILDDKIFVDFPMVEFEEGVPLSYIEAMGKNLDAVETDSDIYDWR